MPIALAQPRIARKWVSMSNYPEITQDVLWMPFQMNIPNHDWWWLIAFIIGSFVELRIVLSSSLHLTQSEVENGRALLFLLLLLLHFYNQKISIQMKPISHFISTVPHSLTRPLPSSPPSQFSVQTTSLPALLPHLSPSITLFPSPSIPARKIIGQQTNSELHSKHSSTIACVLLIWSVTSVPVDIVALFRFSLRIKKATWSHLNVIMPGANSTRCFYCVQKNIGHSDWWEILIKHS